MGAPKGNTNARKHRKPLVVQKIVRFTKSERAEISRALGGGNWQEFARKTLLETIRQNDQENRSEP